MVGAFGICSDVSTMVKSIYRQRYLMSRSASPMGTSAAFRTGIDASLSGSSIGLRAGMSEKRWRDSCVESRCRLSEVGCDDDRVADHL